MRLRRIEAVTEVETKCSGKLVVKGGWGVVSCGMGGVGEFGLPLLFFFFLFCFVLFFVCGLIFPPIFGSRKCLLPVQYSVSLTSQNG